MKTSFLAGFSLIVAIFAFVSSVEASDPEENVPLVEQARTIALNVKEEHTVNVSVDNVLPPLKKLFSDHFKDNPAASLQDLSRFVEIMRDLSSQAEEEGKIKSSRAFEMLAGHMAGLEKCLRVTAPPAHNHLRPQALIAKFAGMGVGVTLTQFPGTQGSQERSAPETEEDMMIKGLGAVEDYKNKEEGVTLLTDRCKAIFANSPTILKNFLESLKAQEIVEETEENDWAAGVIHATCEKLEAYLSDLKNSSAKKVSPEATEAQGIVERLMKSKEDAAALSKLSALLLKEDPSLVEIVTPEELHRILSICKKTEDTLQRLLTPPAGLKIDKEQALQGMAQEMEDKWKGLQSQAGILKIFAKWNVFSHNPAHALFLKICVQSDQDGIKNVLREAMGLRAQGQAAAAASSSSEGSSDLGLRKALFGNLKQLVNVDPDCTQPVTLQALRAMKKAYADLSEEDQQYVVEAWMGTPDIGNLILYMQDILSEEGLVEAIKDGYFDDMIMSTILPSWAMFL